MPKEPLKSYVIAVTGSFGADKDVQKMKQWIEGNGGKFVTKVEQGVTHLISSQESFKKKSAIVVAANKIKGLKIVTFDWLEDCLQKQSKKQETPYLLQDNVAKKERKSKKQNARRENLLTGITSFERECQAVRNQMSLKGHHIYREPESGFAYDVTLVRSDLLEKRKKKIAGEKWVLKVGHILNPIWPAYSPRHTRVPLDKPRAQTLQLYESHEGKHTFYATYATYSAPDGKSAVQVCAPIGTTFPVALDLFKTFFKLKTKRDWEDRNSEPDDVGARFQYVVKADGAVVKDASKKEPEKGDLVGEKEGPTGEKADSIEEKKVSIEEKVEEEIEW